MVCRNNDRVVVRTAWLFAMLLGLGALSGCTGADDPTPDYRYRLRVEVETPEGLKTGSSVIAVEQRLGRSGSSPLNRAIRYRVRGEAVAVDLPGGQTLFALLRSENDVQWSARVMQMLAPDIDGEEWEDVFDNVLLLEGPVEVPRRWTENGLMKGQSAYPMLVTFGDEADPTSVERVDPDDLSASFGEGVELQRITVELTDEPVTTGIEERLGWLSETQGAIGKIPMSERPPSGIALPLHATLSETAFRKRAKK